MKSLALRPSKNTVSILLLSFAIFCGVIVSSPAESATAKFGSVVKDGAFDFKISGMTCGIHQANSFATATGQYCRISIWVKNHSKSKNMFDPSNQVAVDARGRQYEGDTSADLWSGQPLSLKYVNPGLSISGFVWFDMPKGDVPKYFLLHDSAFSSGVKVYR